MLDDVVDPVDVALADAAAEALVTACVIVACVMAFVGLETGVLVEVVLLLILVSPPIKVAVIESLTSSSNNFALP